MATALRSLSLILFALPVWAQSYAPYPQQPPVQQQAVIDTHYASPQARYPVYYAQPQAVPAPAPVQQVQPQLQPSPSDYGSSPLTDLRQMNF